MYHSAAPGSEGIFQLHQRLPDKPGKQKTRSYQCNINICLWAWSKQNLENPYETPIGASKSCPLAFEGGVAGIGNVRADVKAMWPRSQAVETVRAIVDDVYMLFS
jgi:hypothetical protein